MSIRPIFLGSRVARRVFWLFVLSTLVPLALSDWVATSAVADLATSLQERSQVRSTRQTALQVFDRLAAAKATIVTLPAAATASADGDDPMHAEHVERMFESLARIDADGRVARTSAARRDLLATWASADSGADGAAPVPLADRRESTPVTLRIHARPGAAPRLLLGASPGGNLRWIAELRPSYLWAPLVDGAVDSGWLVTDAKGRALASSGEEALIPPPRHGAAAGPGAAEVHRTQLFLGADFGAGDWEFAQKKALPAALWHGAPLAGWLAMVAAATMLLIALVSLRQIRRTLVPLEELTEGTRRLAAGASHTRVRISGEDEFAALGNSFNEMALRIEDQFRSLEALASIDRDVLAGTAIDTVAQRVLEQLGAAYPEVATAILWHGDDAAEGRLLRLSRAAGPNAPVLRRSEPSTAAQAAQFAALTHDEVLHPRSAALAPWSAATGLDERAEFALLPLRWDASTKAVLILGLRTDLHGAALKSAAELRDRLAVAFSARAREKEMVQRAVHDSLTGLANRHGLNEFVDRVLLAAETTAAAILFVDLDNFKDANDSLGHEIGDEVLCEASRRLKDCGPDDALVARQGGDEFVLVLPGADEARAREVAAEAVRRLALPFRIGGEMHTFGGSVGVALYPAHGRTRKELLRHADMAMYAAKSAGRSRYALFDDLLEAATQRRLRLPSELRRALERGELAAHYQPRVDPASGRVTSAEALVRWRHPERGLLMPTTFIAMAEESQLIEEIGLFMLNDACSRMAGWQRDHPELKRVSVNVSPRQLASGDLPGLVEAVLNRHALNPRSLELEVTESLLVDESRDAHAQLAALRRLGVSVALDDFGTGYSSMSMLRNLPIDVMKIDRAFVKDLDDDPGAVAITRTIATLAHALGLHLVAEGVETPTQAALLAPMACDEFQGYLYSKALTPDAFARFCADRARP